MSSLRSGQLAAFVTAAVLLTGAGTQDNRELLWQHRNLGKAYYENPVTQLQAVAEFKQALELAPESAREHVNYGLALLRAGKTQEGIAQLLEAQKRDPRIPHTWFNLGIVYKKDGRYAPATAQFEQMVRLAPGEPVSHYNLGVLYKMASRPAEALREFETAARLNPGLAGPHFQLYNAYRQAGRADEAAAEMKLFQEIKKRNAGAAVPEDMEWSFYSEIYESLDPRPYTNPAGAPSHPRQLGTGFAPEHSGAVVLDFDGDGRADLLAWSPDGIRIFRDGEVPADAHGLGDLKDVISVAPADFDNDGFTDLCVITQSGAFLYRNEKGKLQRLPVTLPAGRYARAVWVDYDHDYDLDLFLLGADSALARNNGAAGFSAETASFPFAKGQAIDAVPTDLIADTGGFDLVVSYQDHAGVLYRDQLGGKYTAAPLDLLPAGARNLAAIDADRDGWTDLSASTAAGDLLLRNREGKFERAAALPNHGLALDTEGGRVDRIEIASDGALCRHAGAAPRHWLRVALTGVKNLRQAPGAKIELKAGAFYEKRTYTGVPVTFDLGERAAADTLRITWPNGLIQNEAKPAIDRSLTVKEAPRLSGSCPMIFTWNGSRFEFLTDVLGVAPLGAGSGDGGYFPVNSRESVLIPAAALAPSNGSYQIRVTEELREVSYLDRIRLAALDHPANLEIFTNDKFQGPPFPEPRLYGVSRRIYPKSAGVPGPDGTELDFGDAAPRNRAILVLHGWVDWADASEFRNAAQQGKPLETPSLQVQDAAGNWRTVIADMGVPSGKPKPIVVDLSGKFLSAARRIRIVTNLRIYWDEIFLSEETARPPARLTDLRTDAAALGFRGFSAVVSPVSFDYSRTSPVSMWNPTPGRYTRYGDVRALLDSADDRFVVMGSGDELRLRFPAAGLPPLPPGWRRDFLLAFDGWAKDGDANTAFSQSVEPLPFHGMSQYPYPAAEHFPADAQHLLYRREFQTRPARRLLEPLWTTTKP